MAVQQLREYENAFGRLRQFVRRPQNVERCELCSVAIASEHPHLLEPIGRKLLCVCDACALLFSGKAGAQFKRVPRDTRVLSNFRMTDAQWDSFMIPINMAFIFMSSPQGRLVAMYPSPAGATESLLFLDAWTLIVQDNPELDLMEADVEALLVNRIGHVQGFNGPEYYLLPIDQCYKLVGLIRMHWKGLSGGTVVWQEIARFFSEIRAKIALPSGGSCA